MPRQQRIQATIDDRTKRLRDDFSTWLERFVSDDPWTGVSHDFHLLTLERLRELGGAALAIDDDWYCERLWTTLATWNMNEKGAELRRPAEFKRALRIRKAEIADLEGMRIDDAAGDAELASRIWGVIARLDVASQKARIVVGTKTLHHLVPELVPPMDRTYTAPFFEYDATRFQDLSGKVFRDIFFEYSALARAVNPQRYVDGIRHTSTTKVLDNAVVAYVKDRVLRGAAKRGGRIRSG